MNTKMSKLVVAMAAMVMAGGVWAADTNTASASATAEVITPITVAKNADLVFGNLVAGNGNVTVSTDGTRTKTGSTALVATGSSPTAAKFTVSGQGSQTFSISTSGTSTQLSTGGGTPSTMAFTLILDALSGLDAAAQDVTSGVDATGTLSNGKATIYAGGTVAVGASQAAGTYTGAISVTVDYN